MTPRPAHRRPASSRPSLGGAAVLAGAASAAAVAAAAAFLLAQPDPRARPPDDAPARDAKRRALAGGPAVVGRAVTINRPRAELYAFWRDFRNLPRFMENIESVEPSGPRMAVWTIAAPGGRVRIETEIVEEREGELIAWRSTPNADIETEGRIRFDDAGPGRGTRVDAEIRYRPPFGEVGRLVAKLFQREPSIQARRDLKRLKMLMEAGEIATSDRRRPA